MVLEICQLDHFLILKVLNLLYKYRIEMRLVKDSISDRQIFSGAFLDQVTASEPLSPKFFRYKRLQMHIGKNQNA